MSETPGFENRCEKTLNEGRHVCLQMRGHEGECRANVNAPWPPVPATPLDVEACVNPERLRNLADRILNMADGRADRDPASLRREAEFVRALASALPGMGKDSERPCPECHHPISRHAPFGCSHETGHFGICGCRARLADDADPRLIPAARAAQPEETSADG